MTRHISSGCPRDRSLQFHPYSRLVPRPCGQASNPLLRDHHTASVLHPVNHTLYTPDSIPLEPSGEWTPEPRPFPCGIREDAAPPAGSYWYGRASPSPLYDNLYLFLENSPTMNGAGPSDAFASFHPPSTYITTRYIVDVASPAMDALPNEYWGITTPQYPSYTTETNPVDSVNKARCQWDSCEVILDDVTHGGLRRHFRDYHHAPRGERMRCRWGSCCRSEEMLFENIPKHIAECHVKSMAQRCPWCNGNFARKDTLKRHQNAGCPAVGQQPQ